MPIPFLASLLSKTMTHDGDTRDTQPAPLPAHERVWRHPSEIAQHKRTLARRPAPPLGPLITSLAGAVAMALIVLVVALVAPGGAPRESVPTTPTRSAVRPVADGIASGFAAVGSERLVLPLGAVAGLDDLANESLLVTIDTPGAVPPTSVVTSSGPTPVAVLRRDTELGLVLLSYPTGAGETVGLAAAQWQPTSAGVELVVDDGRPHRASVGVAITSDTRSFVPLDGDVLTEAVADGATVTDLRGRLVGLYSDRNGARGYVPIAAIRELLIRAR